MENGGEVCADMVLKAKGVCVCVCACVCVWDSDVKYLPVVSPGNTSVATHVWLRWRVALWRL